MLAILNRLLGRLSVPPPVSTPEPAAGGPQPPAPAPDRLIPTALDATNAGLPRTFGPADGAARARVFDPALRQYGAAFRPGDPAVPDPAAARRWAALRRAATDHVLRAVAEGPAGDALVLRGSRLMRPYVGPAAREPGDLDWVADPPGLRPDDPRAARLFRDLADAVFARPAPAGVAFDPAGVATDDIWTYERAPGRRAAFPWRSGGLPGGIVQVDVVFGEALAEPARRVSIPAADGGCVSVRAAGPAQSLAWKLLWLATDAYPQGKDLYDAVLLAERYPLPWATLEATLRAAGEPVPADLGAVLAGGRVDWDNFRAEYPRVEGSADDWAARLVMALGPVAPAAGAGLGPTRLDPAWLTPTVLALASAIYEDRAFDRLPVLADALEEARCDHVEVLSHCRGEGPHARGCWLVDLVLGKE